jgi:hypothetical protein
MIRVGKLLEVHEKVPIGAEMERSPRSGHRRLSPLGPKDGSWPIVERDRDGILKNHVSFKKSWRHQ